MGTRAKHESLTLCSPHPVVSSWVCGSLYFSLSAFSPTRSHLSHIHMHAHVLSSLNFLCLRFFFSFSLCFCSLSLPLHFYSLYLSSSSVSCWLCLHICVCPCVSFCLRFPLSLSFCLRSLPLSASLSLSLWITERLQDATHDFEYYTLGSDGTILVTIVNENGDLVYLDGEVC